ncbi:MAG: hypothetical protein GXO40_03395 [Epsilonproteobacteria bacterium]|nr:hypothetical protein [Campylobacterota bacterium]
MIRLLWLLVTQLWGVEVYISFQYTIQNNQIINEKLEYSKCMSHSSAPIITQIKYFPHHDTLAGVLKYEKEEIIDVLSKNGVFVSNCNITTNFYNNDKIKVTYLPQRFDIIFQDGYLIFKLKGTQ